MKNNLWLAAALAFILVAAAAWRNNRAHAPVAEIMLPELVITAPELMPEITLPEITIQATALPIRTLTLPEVTIYAKKRTGV